VAVAALGAGLWVPGVAGNDTATALVVAVVAAVGWRSARRRAAAAATPCAVTNGVSPHPRQPAGNAGTGDGAGRAWLAVAAVTVLLMAVASVWLLVVREPYETLRPLLPDQPAGSQVGVWLGRRLALAAGQQVALQLFLGPVLVELVGRRWVAVGLGAGIFALAHLPSPFLVLLTFIAGLVWMTLFLRYRRLLPLVVSHVVLWAFAYAAIPERFSANLHVGLGARDTWPRFVTLQQPWAREILRVVGSEAYWQGAGASPEGFVRALYRDVLGRVPADAEVAFWVRRMAWEPRVEVAKKFVVSDELAALRQQLGAAYGFPLRR